MNNQQNTITTQTPTTSSSNRNKTPSTVTRTSSASTSKSSQTSKPFIPLLLKEDIALKQAQHEINIKYSKFAELANQITGEYKTRVTQAKNEYMRQCVNDAIRAFNQTLENSINTLPSNIEDTKSQFKGIISQLAGQFYVTCQPYLFVEKVSGSGTHVSEQKWLELIELLDRYNEYVSDDSDVDERFEELRKTMANVVSSFMLGSIVLPNPNPPHTHTNHQRIESSILTTFHSHISTRADEPSTQSNNDQSNPPQTEDRPRIPYRSPSIPQYSAPTTEQIRVNNDGKRYRQIEHYRDEEEPTQKRRRSEQSSTITISEDDDTDDDTMHVENTDAGISLDELRSRAISFKNYGRLYVYRDMLKRARYVDPTITRLNTKTSLLSYKKKHSADGCVELSNDDEIAEFKKLYPTIKPRNKTLRLYTEDFLKFGSERFFGGL